MKFALGLEGRVTSQVGDVPSAIGTRPMVVHAGNQAAQVPARTAAPIAKRSHGPHPSVGNVRKADLACRGLQKFGRDLSGGPGGSIARIRRGG